MYSEHTLKFLINDLRLESQAVENAAASVRQQLALAENDSPSIGVILGSGLGTAADRLLANGGKSLCYSSIPGMPVPHVAGHHGRLVYGRICGIRTVMLQGRIHCYEGHTLQSVQFGTRLLHALGVQTLIVTNAAGGIRADFAPGDLMVITSHLRPLATSWMRWHSRDPCVAQWSLVDTTNGRCSLVPSAGELLWKKALRERIKTIRSPLQIHEGVYAMMAGPNYETPAEIRALQRLGADAVGMNTVPEALLAAELGMQVLGVSCITNVAAGLSAKSLSHAEVTATAAGIETPFANWMADVIEAIGERETSVR